MRSPWTEVGVFDRDTRSYVVDRIPRPPEARAFFERDVRGRESLAGHEMKVGCQKCFSQTIVRWERRYTDHFVADFRDEQHPELMAVVVAQKMTEIANQAEAVAIGSRRREEEARLHAEKMEAAFRRIQVKRSTQRKRKERKRRSRNKGKR